VVPVPPEHDIVVVVPDVPTADLASNSPNLGRDRRLPIDYSARCSTKYSAITATRSSGHIQKRGRFFCWHCRHGALIFTPKFTKLATNNKRIAATGNADPRLVACGVSHIEGAEGVWELMATGGGGKPRNLSGPPKLC